MKKRIPVFLAALFFLTLILSGPALAVGSDQGIPRKMESIAGSTENPASLSVWDTAGLLSSSEAQSLQTKAAQLADNYQYGCYLVTVNNYELYNPNSIMQACITIYNDLQLGIGEKRCGVMLLLSMSERDYYVVYYPDTGNPAFTDYGSESLDAYFLDNFKKNDWSGGFSDYLDRCGTILKMASEGTILDEDTDPARIAAKKRMTLLIGFIAGTVLALVVCGIFLAGMKSATEAVNADQYAVPGSARITSRQDRFLRRSTVTRHIERNNSSGGGGSSHSGGFSGHGGKF